MKAFRILRNNRGTSMILFTLLLTALIGLCAVVADIGTLIIEKQKFQNALDSAALAAALELPDTSKASYAATKYIQLNGFQSSNILVSFSDSNSRIDIKGTKDIPYTFAKIFGLKGTTVNPSASAAIGSIGDAFNYVLFSGSKNTTLTLNGSSQYVKGSAHTNRNFVANGSKITITGACEALSTVTVNGSQISIGSRVPNASYVEMPDFSEVIRLQAEQAGQVFNGDKVFNGSYMDIDAPIYVKGNVTVNGSHFKGKGCVLATGNITFNGSNLNASTQDAVCFYSKSGDITVNGASAEFDGILYAPNGSITLNGSNQTVNGRVIGNSVAINGSGLSIIGGTNELKSIPSSGIKLIK
ncbi:MAG: pilus assembly protein TadG-related protein [Clostridia bacterium]|nr:pilus assembly protein TadG-related protein [Clostridia bacterium]